MNVRNFFTKEEQDRIVRAIAALESRSSAEVRVHLESYSSKNPLNDAAHAFARLKMHRTARRNGVLVYVATGSHTCAIIGDAGINSKVDRAFWDACCGEMTALFGEGKYVEGVLRVLEMAGEKLAEFFPAEERDENELPNEISYGE